MTVATSRVPPGAVRLDAEPRQQQRFERGPLRVEECRVQEAFLRRDTEVMGRIVDVHRD